MQKDVKALDLDYYENVILLNSLANQEYLATIIEHVNLDFFSDKNIKVMFNIIFAFFQERGVVPTATEIKSRLTSDSDKTSFS